MSLPSYYDDWRLDNGLEDECSSLNGTLREYEIEVQFENHTYASTVTVYFNDDNVEDVEIPFIYRYSEDDTEEELSTQDQKYYHHLFTSSDAFKEYTDYAIANPEYLK